MGTDSKRNSIYERDFLELVCKQAGITGSGVNRFVEGVYRRLDDGQEEYGADSFLDKPLAPEMDEESLDMVAWGLLWAQQLTHLERQGLLALDQGHHIRLHIIEAAAHAVRAHNSITAAQKIFRDNVAAKTKGKPLVGYRHYFED
jgi:hypothetical protein